ncbi:cohesin domain-containing protein [Candidatus Aminicenantes bacterium AC-334-K16]|jgi:general secretion pathway protein D|nr:cohesin domain-containing protein [Candidatus Aminicenantes bacterium AC-334-K16]
MKKTVSLIIIALFIGGCATLSQNYRRGTEAAMAKQWDEAVTFFQEAVLDNPKSSVYRLALLRAQVSASRYHWIQGKKLARQGKKHEAITELEKALMYDPTNQLILKDLQELAGQAPPEEKEEETTVIEPPIKIQVKPEKIDLKFRQKASLKSIFTALGKHAGINILFDEQFKDIPFSIDLEGMTFEQALQSLCLATRNFYRPVDEKTVIIVPDLPQKRMQYEIQAIKTFYLSNVKAEEIQAGLNQMLRTQFKAPTVIIDKNLNSITVRDTPEVVERAEKIIKLWDKPKGEVIIDLEIMEVSRMKLRQLGIDFDQYGGAIRYNQENATDGWLNLADLSFKQKENFQLVLPSAFIQMLESDADTKIISQPRLRGIEGEKLEYVVGDEIPIPRTTWAPIAAGGISTQPITSFEYKNVGIDVKITPYIHYEDEVTLELEIQIKSLGGTGYANIPIITTREVRNVIRLKNGETNLLAGLLKDEERKTLKGIAGLKSIPLIGRLFSNTDQTIQQTDVILTITPYIIRKTPIGDKDREPIWVGIKETTGKITLAELPERGMKEAALRMREMSAPTQPGAEVNHLYFNTTRLQMRQGRTFRLMINIQAKDEIANMSFNVSYNPEVVELKQVAMGGFVRQMGPRPSFLQNIDNSSGSCTIGFTAPDVGRGRKGGGTIAVLVFQAKEPGEATLSFSGISAMGPTGTPLVFETRDCQVVIR